MNTQETCDMLKAHQRQRVIAVRASLRLEHASKAFLRSILGFSFDLTEPERKKVCTRASQLLKAIRINAVKPKDAEVAKPGVKRFVMSIEEARDPIIKNKKVIEKAMIAAAKSLPVSPWVTEQKGFGDMGLAIIVGEAGNLEQYSGPAKLWKRMGLALVNGKRQGSPGKNASAEEWIAHGYCPRRRSAMWTIGDSMIKQGEGTWGYDMYAARKAYELERDPDMTKMHSHRRAQRVMEKELLKRLWTAWRQAS